MTAQDFAKLLIVIICFAACVAIWRACRPIWTVRFRGRIHSVVFYAYTEMGMRRQARAFQRRNLLGYFKARKGT